MLVNKVTHLTDRDIKEIISEKLKVPPCCIHIIVKSSPFVTYDNDFSDYLIEIEIIEPFINKDDVEKENEI